MADIGTLEQWYYDVPIVTRVWTTATVLAAVLVQCGAVTPYRLFFNPQLVWDKREYWRLITTFIYFGPLSIDIVFHIFFMSRYSRQLEESSFRGQTAEFAWLTLFSATSLLLLSIITEIAFLGPALSSSFIYIWARRNPGVRLSVLGLFVFPAPYMPWFLIGLGALLNRHVPKEDLCGLAVGHVYYYFSDIYPGLAGGSHPLDPPQFWKRLFDGQNAAAIVAAERRRELEEREHEHDE